MLRTFTRTSRTFRIASIRPFSQSAAAKVEGYPNNASTNAKTDTSMLPDDEHSVNKAKKGDKNDIQTSNLSDGLKYVYPLHLLHTSVEAREHEQWVSVPNSRPRLRVSRFKMHAKDILASRWVAVGVSS
jgi:hypothetical protein